jgi:hypothetical protein
MFEAYAALVLAAAAVVMLIGFVWLLLRAARLSAWWVVALVLFPPATMVLIAVRFRQVTGPAVMLLFGVLIASGVFGLNVLLTHHLDLGPRERIVDGQRHITLTGWDKSSEDYAVLATKPDTVVLQLANADVTDDTLVYLQEFQFMQELDLNDTQITDVGLARLAELPRLRILRLRGTRVTDEGFREHLLDNASLEEVDARETAVTGRTLREWKNAQPDARRYLK